MRALGYAFVGCLFVAGGMTVWLRRVWREITGARVAP